MSLSEVRARIEAACGRVQRNPSTVKLLAVSKLQSPESIRGLLEQGQLDFGENYVQELNSKMTLLSKEQIQWHLIGHLQKNKIKNICGLCTRIHSVDSLELAKSLNDKAVSLGHVEKVLFQVNLSGENSKEGFSEELLRTNWSFIQSLQGLRAYGLMTMPPLQNLPEENRIYFSRLRELLTEMRNSGDQNLHPMNELSMGTSQDFEVAIEEGATWVRVGTLVFGERSRQRS